MHGEREHPLVSGEDVGRSVALVDVQIQDGDTPRHASLHQPRCGDSHVVEQAEALTVGRERVVEAPAQVRRHSLLHGQPPCEHRSPAAEDARLPQGGGERHLQPHALQRRELILPDLLEVFGRVDPGQLIP